MTRPEQDEEPTGQSVLRPSVEAITIHNSYFDF